MGLFNRKKQDSKWSGLEGAIMRALVELEPSFGHDFVPASTISGHLGGGLRMTSPLEQLEAAGILERGKNVDGVWGDRLTPQGRAELGI